jgi:hypothetical protein
MNKMLISFVLAFLANVGTAQAANCTAAIQAAKPYKGVVATVNAVSAKKVYSPDAGFYTEGVRYDFVYRYPSGYQEKTYTIMSPNDKDKIETGDKMIWMPAADAVRKLFPAEDRHVPAIVTKSCKIFGVDFSTPAKEIAGL